MIASADGHRRSLERLLNAWGRRNGPPILRIGGNSEDMAAWDLPLVKHHRRAITINITSRFCHNIRRLCQRTGVRLILGLNLGRGSPAMARRWVREARKRIGANHILAFEIGNEPDAYVLTHQRRTGYTLADYESDFARFANAIKPLMPRPGMIAGPAFSCFWLKGQTAAFIRRMHRMLGLVTVHDYPLGIRRAIPQTTSVRYDSVAHLLDRRSSYIYYSIIRPAVIAATPFHLPVRWGEMNSAAGGGDQGISDSFASVLWLTNSLFYAAKAGAAGVNLHNAGAKLCPYSIFRYDHAGQLVPHPDYDAMLLFAAAASHHAKLLPVRIRGGARVRVWATRDTRDHVRVVIVNSRLHHVARVILPAAGYEAAAMVTVTAPDIRSVNMPVWHKRRFGDSKPSVLNMSGLMPIKHTGFSVRVPPTSIYMLTLKRPSGKSGK